MPDIFLIGTDHRYQFSQPNTSEADIAAFSQLIIQVCTRYSIANIAEEMSLDALHARQLTSSIPKLVSRKLGIPHLYCDPSVSEQASRGIADENAVRATQMINQTNLNELEQMVALERKKREPIWLEKLERCAIWPTLFIFGSWHSSSFSQLLVERGHSFAFIHADWRA